MIAVPDSERRLTDDERKIVEDNTRLVHWYVGRICRMDTQDERDEAYADGVFGLMRAAQKFRPELGYKFSTYALFWIKQSVAKGRDNRMGKNYRSAKAKGVDWLTPASLDAPVGDDSDSLGDFLTSEADVEAEAGVTALLDELVGRARNTRFDMVDRAIVTHLFDGGLLYETKCAANTAIGHRYGLSQEAIRRRRKRIEELLRPMVA